MARLRGLFSQWAHRTYHLDKIGDSGDPANQREGLSHPFAESNLTTSLIIQGPFASMHTVAIDLDVPAVLIPSSTPGHSHLYIDVPMEWGVYAELLKALADAGVLEEGYVKAALHRKHTALRMPWVRKGDDSIAVATEPPPF